MALILLQLCRLVIHAERIHLEHAVFHSSLPVRIILHVAEELHSSGIALLIRIVRAGRKAGYRTFAYGLTPHYQKLFRMVGLTEYMMIYPDEYTILARIEEAADSSGPE